MCYIFRDTHDGAFQAIEAKEISITNILQQVAKNTVPFLLEYFPFFIIKSPYNIQ